jgi:hypothetical protein
MVCNLRRVSTCTVSACTFRCTARPGFADNPRLSADHICAMAAANSEGVSIRVWVGLRELCDGQQACSASLDRSVEQPW